MVRWGECLHQSRSHHHSLTKSCGTTVNQINLAQPNFYPHSLTWCFTSNILFCYIVSILPDNVNVFHLPLSFISFHSEQYSYQYPQGSPQGWVGPS